MQASGSHLRRLSRWLVFASLLALTSALVGAPAPEAPIQSVHPRHDRQAAVQAALMDPDRSHASRVELSRLYASRDFQTIWLDSDDRPNASADEALRLLAGAFHHGLDPETYGTKALSALAATLNDAASTIDMDQLATFDLRLSAGVLGYLRHLHVGRVEPSAVRFKIPSRAQEHDYGAVLLAAIDGGHLQQAADDLGPSLALYRALQKALPRYRLLAQEEGPATLPAVGRSIQTGDAYMGTQALSRRLTVLGDLPPDEAESAGPADVYTHRLSEGVKRFQRRHGLADDGVLGKATLAAMNVPLTWRVRQIELAMERLRWLPHPGAQPFVAINIPAFRLWARDATSSLDMAVIVGRAMNTQTPVFIDEMTHVIFRPHWNVPRSIVRNEIVPALSRDPHYLQRHDMEIVRGSGNDARPLLPVGENIALLRTGALQLRQRPGPANSLGLVKFVFPNDQNVYMHDTPARQLFARSRRDFSHGCIRLEDPTALAEWALKDQRDWPRERIVAAMHGSSTVRVDLTRPVKVVLFYVTATVGSRDGLVHFTDDIYGHDATLDRALRASG